MIVDGDDEIMLDNVGYGAEVHDGSDESHGDGSNRDHATLGMRYGGSTDLLQSARTEDATTMRVGFVADLRRERVRIRQ